MGNQPREFDGKLGPNASKYLKQFKSTLTKSGLKVVNETFLWTHYLRDVNDPTLETEFIACVGKDLDVNFLIIILPDIMYPKNNIALYNRIKQLGDIKYGIHTVCVPGSTKKFMNPKEERATQYHANVALKINLKLGGTNHLLSDADIGIITNSKTMVIGLDVTHPSPGSGDAAPSIAAMVASVDSQLAQWSAELCINGSETEIVEKHKIKSMLAYRLGF